MTGLPTPLAAVPPLRPSRPADAHGLARRPAGHPRGMAGDLAQHDDGRRVLLLQGGYYLVTGVAPFVSRRAFERVTGPKAEGWLVQTVGGLAMTIGGALLSAAVRRSASPELVGLAAGSAVTFAAVDVVHA